MAEHLGEEKFWVEPVYGRYDQNAAAAAGSDECVHTSVALPLTAWMTWTRLRCSCLPARSARIVVSATVWSGLARTSCSSGRTVPPDSSVILPSIAITCATPL